jgi:hypothetical protein
LLEDLSSAQQELLDVLVQKRTLLARGDVAGLAGVQERELSLVERLTACQQRRNELLAIARDEQRPADSIATLAASLRGPKRDKLGKQVKDSRLQMRLLQNETLTNWVLAQRLLLHVSQMVEIIATGGRMKPTYAEGDSSIHARGALVNDEA